MDSTASTFDNYYKQLLAGKGVFGSDQGLFSDYRTKWIFESFAKDQSLFFREFAAPMVKLGNVGVMENGEVRSEIEMPSGKLRRTEKPRDLFFNGFFNGKLRNLIF